MASNFFFCSAQDPGQDPTQEPKPRTSSPSNFQNENSNKSSFTDRLFTGGDVSLQFGNQTYIQIAPLLGYRVTDQFSAGITGKYIYYSYTDSYSAYKYKTNIYGGGVFMRYNVTQELFLHSEYEGLSIEVPFSVYQLKRRIVSALFLGGGYRQFIGESSSLNLMLLYDVIGDQYSPYQNPIIRIGFDFGL